MIADIIIMAVLFIFTIYCTILLIYAIIYNEPNYTFIFWILTLIGVFCIIYYPTHLKVPEKENTEKITGNTGIDVTEIYWGSGLSTKKDYDK